MKVSEKWDKVYNNIRNVCERTNRKTQEVNVVAVTKYVTNERAQEGVDVGLVHLGENRYEGLIEKQKNIIGEAKWHFIGTLQSRKVKDVIDHIDYLHSLDRLSLAKEINKRAQKKVNCFVQVNVSDEEQKHGLSPQKVFNFIEQVSNYDKINVVGLMTMAPNTSDEVVLRQCFRDLAHLRNEIHKHGFLHAPCTELSMGMSNDYEIAIEEGATFVRIGSALVGE
ncbi:YggS family pyridoxal phosphate-dependent enzyme [Jeotgalibacillus marinus]|uniref:Pyridoxal phosphate homeostasis protein n=1 Tax=Jeotgalibacillus marinus TaxID=86667 RepID=A0ABV3Q209_9BACL